MLKDFHKVREYYGSVPVQVKASLWFLICSFMQRGISVITTPIFTRLLSTSEYGQYGVFTSWLGIASAVVTLNLCYGMYSQGLIKFEEDRARFSSSLQGLAFVLVNVWTAVYLIAKDGVNALTGLTTAQTLLMLVMVWTSTVFNFWATSKRVNYDYRLLVAVTIAVSLLKPVLGIALVVNSSDRVTARVFGLALVELLGYGWMFFIQMKQGRTFFSRKYWKYALLFCIPLVPHYLSQVVLSSVNRIMIANMVGDSQAGIFNLANSISTLATLLNSALVQTIEPWMFRSMRANRMDRMKTVAYPALIAVAAVNLLLISFAPEAVAVFAPQEYLEAIWVIPPISISVFFNFSYVLYAEFEFYFEKTRYLSLATLAGAALNVGLNLMFIPVYGYLAAGYVTFVCYAAFALLHYAAMCRICRRKFGIVPYSAKVVGGISLAFTVVGLSYLALYGTITLRYGITALLLLIVFAKRRVVIRGLERLMNARKEKEHSTQD